MEAPEKIYVDNPNHDFWYRTKAENSMEYTRTDAFIEKACEFLKDRIEHDSIDYPMATKYLVEDFRKYMKGE